jgi:hypothetical protein
MAVNIKQLAFVESADGLWIDLVVGDQIYAPGDVDFQEHGILVHQAATGVTVDRLIFVPYANVKQIFQET